MSLAPRSLSPAILLRPGAFRVLVLFLAIMGPGPAAGAGDPPVGPALVLVGVAPLRTIVERIGGDAVRVSAVVQPGQNPHAFEPSPRQVADLERADLYLRVGVPLEDAWLPRLGAANPGLRVLDLRAGIPARAHDQDRWPAADGSGVSGHGLGGDHQHDPSAPDTHIWTSPVLVRGMVAAIRDALSDLRPDQAEVLRANAGRLSEDLEALDGDLRARLAPLRQRRFLVFHPAWGYFADTYGLTQLAIEHEGKEPGPRALAALIAAVRAVGVRLVLVQPQFSPRAAQQVAAAIGGELASVDPLDPDYFGTLRRLTDLIVAGDAR